MARYITNNKTKIVAVIVTCISLVLGTIGGVWAYLSAQTEPVTNTFVPAKVSCAVEESFQDGVKSNVTVRNTGNVDAYVRTVVVATFVSDDGKVLATAPKEGVDYTVTWGNAGWLKGSDGYWYYSSAIAPNQATPILIETASAITAPSGYRLNLQILATAVQADPQRAVTDAWGITPTDGKLIPQ